MCTTLQLNGRTGVANISVANSNLNGTGTLTSVLAVAPDGAVGTEVSSVIIKATGSTSQGMVRLFVYNGSSYFLLREISIPAVTQSGTIPAYEFTITNSFYLETNESLYASTQNAESFNIIANAVDWINCPCNSVCNSSIQRIADMGIVNISTANANLNGSGTLGTVLTSSSVELSGGTQIDKVNIKATGSTSEGMVRLFLNDGSNNFLIREISIPASTQSGVQPAFRTVCHLGFLLEPGFSLRASTQVANSFNVVTQSYNILNCTCIE